jgi:hypothetical protein
MPKCSMPAGRGPGKVLAGGGQLGRRGARFRHESLGRVQAAVGAEAAPFFGELDITTAQRRGPGQLKHHGIMTGRELAARRASSRSP